MMSTRLTFRIREINEWMSSNRLKLNADKPYFIWLGTRQQLSKVNCDSVVLYGVNIKTSREVTLLGVVIDKELKFTSHIKRLTGRCYYQLRKLRTVRRALSKETSKLLVHALIISRLDYCNSVFNNVAAVHLHPLQSVLNAAVRLVIQRRKYDHITADIRNYLHWLPVNYRIDFKLCALVYK